MEGDVPIWVIEGKPNNALGVWRMIQFVTDKETHAISYCKDLNNPEPMTIDGDYPHPYIYRVRHGWLAAQQLLAVDASQDGSQSDDGSGSRH